MSILPAGPTAYDPGDGWDEAFAAPGVPREHYAGVMEALARTGPRAAAEATRAWLRERGVTFGGEDFVVDPVPRLITASEWEEVAAGLRQRVLALDAFLADVHGERRAVAAGVVPEQVVAGAPYLEEDLRGARPAGGARVAIAGLDLVRGADGRFRVLEDNVRTPSGSVYGLAASQAVEEALPVRCPHADAARELGDALRWVLEAANPGAEGELVLLTDGPSNPAWHEHVRLAELAGLRIARPPDLRRRGARLELRDGGAPVRAVYRRTDEDRLRDEDGTLTDAGELLLEPLLEGTVGLVNHYGNGLADDKRVYPYVDDLVRFHLGEEPRLPSVPTYDLADRDTRSDVVENIGDVVVKPRDGYGGDGVTVGPTAGRTELREAREAVQEDPSGWIAQDPVALSTHPTVVGDRLKPRHVDLRPFAFCDGAEVRVVPGGLTRVALEEGSMVVNSSSGGGGKATWVLAGER